MKSLSWRELVGALWVVTIVALHLRPLSEFLGTIMYSVLAR
jgi:hypothetical protein